MKLDLFVGIIYMSNECLKLHSEDATIGQSRIYNAGLFNKLMQSIDNYGELTTVNEYMQHVTKIGVFLRHDNTYIFVPDDHKLHISGILLHTFLVEKCTQSGSKMYRYTGIENLIGRVGSKNVVRYCVDKYGHYFRSSDGMYNMTGGAKDTTDKKLLMAKINAVKTLIVNDTKFLIAQVTDANTAIADMDDLNGITHPSNKGYKHLRAKDGAVLAELKTKMTELELAKCFGEDNKTATGNLNKADRDAIIDLLARTKITLGRIYNGTFAKTAAKKASAHAKKTAPGQPGAALTAANKKTLTDSNTLANVALAHFQVVAAASTEPIVFTDPVVNKADSTVVALITAKNIYDKALANGVTVAAAKAEYDKAETQYDAFASNVKNSTLDALADSSIIESKTSIYKIVDQIKAELDAKASVLPVAKQASYSNVEITDELRDAIGAPLAPIDASFDSAKFTKLINNIDRVALVANDAPGAPVLKGAVAMAPPLPPPLPPPKAAAAPPLPPPLPKVVVPPPIAAAAPPLLKAAAAPPPPKIPKGGPAVAPVIPQESAIITPIPKKYIESNKLMNKYIREISKGVFQVSKLANLSPNERDYLLIVQQYSDGKRIELNV